MILIYLEQSLALFCCVLKNLVWPLSRPRGEEPSLLVQRGDAGTDIMWRVSGVLGELAMLSIVAKY